MTIFKKLAAATALALCALAPTVALAAGKVLYLSTAEGASPCPTGTPNNPSNGAHFITNAVAALEPKATGGFINRAGALSTDYQIGKASSYFTAERANWPKAEADFNNLSAGDVVVVQAAYHMIEPTKAEFIVKQIKKRNDLVFLLLLDTCKQCSFNSETCTTAEGKNTTNLDRILNPAINQANGWSVYGQHLDGSSYPHVAPNTGSPYYSRLNPQINPMKGHTIGTMQCTPKQNVIYPVPTDPSAYTGNSWTVLPSSYPELNENSSYGTFVPFWQSNYGKGACLYLATDNNMFDNTAGAAQHNNIAQMVMNLYSGACQVTAQQAGICTGINLSAGERCRLVNAPAGTPASELVVQATADGVCKDQMWKIVPPGAPVPTTGWPALLGLGALLPLLARRRRSTRRDDDA